MLVYGAEPPRPSAQPDVGLLGWRCSVVGQFEKLTHSQYQRLAISLCESRAFRQTFIAQR